MGYFLRVLQPLSKQHGRVAQAEKKKTNYCECRYMEPGTSKEDVKPKTQDYGFLNILMKDKHDV